MIIEMQVTSECLMQGLRNQLCSSPWCFTTEFPFGGQTVLVDHFEITEKSHLGAIPSAMPVVSKDGVTRTIDGMAAKFTQEVILHLVTLTSLQKSGAAPTTPIKKISTRISVLLKPELDAGKPCIRYSYQAPADIGDLALMPNAQEQIDSALSKISGILPIRLGSMGDFLPGGSLLYSNIGIAVNEDRNSLTMRLEHGTDPDNVARWGEFYAGVTQSELVGHNFSVFIDKREITSIVLSLLSPAGLPASAFVPKSAMSAEWAESDHGVHATQRGVVPNSGPLGGDTQVTLSFDFDFSIQSPDVLLVDLNASAAGEFTGFEGFLADLLGIDPNVAPGLPEIADWEKTGPHAYRRPTYLSLSSMILGHCVTQGIEPNSNGLLLVGSAVPSHPVDSAIVDATLTPFKWDVRGRCGDYVSAVAAIELANSGTAPLVVCEAAVLADPDQQFQLSVMEAGESSNAFVAVEVLELKSSYLQRTPPYPCLVIVKTNGGSRFVSLGVPRAITDEEAREAHTKRIILVGNCKTLVNDFGDGKVAPPWIPDPPPDKSWIHVWDIVAQGLSRGEQVSAVDSEGRLLSAGKADGAGTINLQAVLQPQRDDKRELTLLRGKGVYHSELRKDFGSEGKLVIRQISMKPAGMLRLNEKPIQILKGSYHSLPVLLAMGRSGAYVYDISSPEHPLMVDQMAVGDIQEHDLSHNAKNSVGDVRIGQQLVSSAVSPDTVLVGKVLARLRPGSATAVLYATVDEVVV